MNELESIVCPRCQKTGKIPVVNMHKKLCCSGCGMEFVPKEIHDDASGEEFVNLDIVVSDEPSIDPDEHFHTRGKSRFLGILGTLVYFYFLIAGLVFIPYYNWQYANTHGFAKWIFFGEIVATSKAIVWPYFTFFGPPSSKSSWEAVSNSIKSAQEASRLIEGQFNGNSTGTISKSDPAIALYREALLEARQADRDVLNTSYPSFGDHFYQDFIGALELLVGGFEQYDLKMLNDGQQLLNRWGDWYNANLDGIRGT